jgi:hypothetical protein
LIRRGGGGEEYRQTACRHSIGRPQYILYWHVCLSPHLRGINDKGEDLHLLPRAGRRHSALINQLPFPTGKSPTCHRSKATFQTGESYVANSRRGLTCLQTCAGASQRKAWQVGDFPVAFERRPRSRSSLHPSFPLVRSCYQFNQRVKRLRSDQVLPLRIHILVMISSIGCWPIQ